MTGTEFIGGLVAEMEALFARLGERQALEAESEGQVDVKTLLRLALNSELEASELAALWMPSTPEIDVKHHELARAILERLCTTAELQEAAAAGTRNTLAIADELSTLAQKSTGMHAIPGS